MDRASMGERFAFPENMEITINGETATSFRKAAIRMAERYEDSIVAEIVKEAEAAGYTEVTVLNKPEILEAMRRHFGEPLTNADRIRASSDDELEDFIRKIAIHFEPWCDNHCKMDGDDDCNKCLAKWLQQPAGEGEKC